MIDKLRISNLFIYIFKIMNTNTNSNYKENKYICQKCGVETMLTEISNIVCKSCGWRIFRKTQCENVIRVRAI
jgi:DNA-directed RNA polymerase subunit RPC12/RpoP